MIVNLIDVDHDNRSRAIRALATATGSGFVSARNKYDAVRTNAIVQVNVDHVDLVQKLREGGWVVEHTTVLIVRVPSHERETAERLIEALGGTSTIV